MSHSNHNSDHDGSPGRGPAELEPPTPAQPGDGAKAQFLAMMSHEMRTPLHAISGMVDLLDASSPTLEQRGFIRRIRANSGALLHLIEDILDFTSLEEGQVQIEVAPFSPAELVEDVAAGLWPRAAGRGLTFEARVDPCIPALVIGDANRVRQLLVNLVGNALKFTARGGVLITLGRQHDPDRLRFEVADTGPGVPVDLRGAIFERFVRGAASTSGHVPGTGLGLAICQMLVERMGGTIGVEEAEGRGSVFFFELPLETPEPESVAETASLEGVDVRILAPHSQVGAALRDELTKAGAVVHGGPDPDAAWPGAGSQRVLIGLGHQFPPRVTPSVLGPTLGRVAICPQGFPDWTRLGPCGVGAAVGSPVRFERLVDAIRRVVHLDAAEAYVAPVGDHDKPRVLLVEDDEDSRGLLQRALLRAGYYVDAARNGAVGFEKVGHFQYDLIVTDLQMPFVDGFELARSVRSREVDERRERLPIVAVSAHALPGYRERCLAAGMDAYLTKPVDRLMLLETVAQHVDARPVVLVGDDCADARALAAAWLRNDRDIRLVYASNGLEVLERCAQGRVSLVLLDMGMPELDGYSAARALRSRLGPDLPILAVTGESGPGAERRCLDAGCSDYLLKPLTQARLLETTERYLGPPAPGTAEPVVVTIDAELGELVPRYLASQRTEAKRLATLVIAGQFEEVRRSAHRTKGSGAAYGFEQLTSLAEELEAAAAAETRELVEAKLDELTTYLDNVILAPGGS